MSGRLWYSQFLFIQFIKSLVGVILAIYLNNLNSVTQSLVLIIFTIYAVIMVLPIYRTENVDISQA